VDLKGKKVIQIDLSDTESEVVNEVLHLPVNIKTMKPHFSITPSDNRIEFGVHKSGTQVDQKTFKINNDGDIPLNFSITPNQQLPSHQDEQGE